jgi:hypothetical protein
VKHCVIELEALPLIVVIGPTEEIHGISDVHDQVARVEQHGKCAQDPRHPDEPRSIVTRGSCRNAEVGLRLSHCRAVAQPKQRDAQKGDSDTHEE